MLLFLSRKLPSCFQTSVLVCGFILVLLWVVAKERQAPWKNIIQGHYTDSSHDTFDEFKVRSSQLDSYTSIRKSKSNRSPVISKTNLKTHGDALMNSNPRDFWTMSYEARSEFQKQQVDAYCKSHMPEDKTQLPGNQIMLHKMKKLAFCYVPKSACTTFKILILHSQGLLSDEYLDYNMFKQPVMAPQLRKTLLGNLNVAYQRVAIRDYFKYVMFRHPLERLLSGYRSKMSVAINEGKTVDEDDRYIEGDKFLWAKREIISYSFPKVYRKWEAAQESYPVNITFSDFIDYWLKSEKLSSNPHFNSIVKLCNPCLVRYDYYGNFKTFVSDAKLLMDKIGASPSELRPQYPQPSDSLVHQFYGQLNKTQKIAVVKKLAAELELYYMLFPPEKDSHKQMLEIKEDIY